MNNKLKIKAYINTTDGVKITVEVPVDITIGKMTRSENNKLSLPLSAKIDDTWFKHIVNSIADEDIENMGVVTNENLKEIDRC